MIAKHFPFFFSFLFLSSFFSSPLNFIEMSVSSWDNNRNHLLLVNNIIPCILQFLHFSGPLVMTLAVLSADFKLCDSVCGPSNLFEFTTGKRRAMLDTLNAHNNGSQGWSSVWPVTGRVVYGRLSSLATCCIIGLFILMLGQCTFLKVGTYKDAWMAYTFMWIG